MKKIVSFLLTGIIIFSLSFVSTLPSFAKTTAQWEEKVKEKFFNPIFVCEFLCNINHLVWHSHNERIRRSAI